MARFTFSRVASQTWLKISMHFERVQRNPALKLVESSCHTRMPMSLLSNAHNDANTVRPYSHTNHPSKTMEQNKKPTLPCSTRVAAWAGQDGMEPCHGSMQESGVAIPPAIIGSPYTPSLLSLASSLLFAAVVQTCPGRGRIFS